MPLPGYRLAAWLTNRLPLKSGKLAHSVSGRGGAVTRWLHWASTQRTDAPLVWVHAASVGEGLAAEPVIRRLRVAIPDVQIIHTHSSPSVVTWPGSFGADATDFVPRDEPTPVATVMEALNPALVLFSRGDLWPEVITQALNRGLPVAVSGATVRPSSKRLRQPVRTLFRHLYDSISWVGAVSDADAERWIRLGTRPPAVTVTGDPRHDHVIERLPRLRPLAPLLAWRQAKVVLVAGSTHQQDEAVLLQALAVVSERFPSAGLVLVPHDPPGPARLGVISHLASRSGVAVEHWVGGPLAADVPCVTVSQLGSLADVYACGDLAYVGGGFQPGRLHSTAEPAVYGLPLIVGPARPEAADAASLLEAGAAVSLPKESPVDGCVAAWLYWAEEERLRVTAGLAGRVRLTQGASRATVSALLPLIG
jgi:3-deoxy-D-manno-octulosonic-acid transferase